ncbi:hypothetical protein [Paenibacillus cymbidii]|uniref:hypothetical protein n=1 Tax=Paenibacillus cymbidii TaxID=1639034 RepID=UPI0010805D86|nr:hypothetical protein [Paenibacillus cymbidii]
MAHFRYICGLPDTFVVIRNTLFISAMKIVAGLAAPIAAALLLNEVRRQLFRRSLQTVIYLPHFLSWVILAGILIDVLSPTTGVVNAFLHGLGLPKVFFLGPQLVPLHSGCYGCVERIRFLIRWLTGWRITAG